MNFTDHKLNQQYKTYLKENFNTSIVIPIDDLNLFNLCLKTNISYFKRNGLEIILVISYKISIEEILSIAKKEPFVNWKIYKTSSDCLADFINIGILNSCKDFVFILPPCVLLENDVIYLMRYQSEFYSTSFTVCEIKKNETSIGIGHVFVVNRQFLLQINLLNNNLNSWHELYHNTIARLEFAGITRIFICEGLLNSINDVFFNPPTKIVNEIFYPQSSTISHKAGASIEYTAETIYDWSNNKFAHEQCCEYLAKFKSFTILNTSIFEQKFPIIALLQTRNEINNITEVLSDLDQHVDGIILLDDGSTDLTYEIAQSSKLLLKAKKEFLYFNDLENRNILLDIASFFQSTWLFFIDADERIDKKFGSPRQFLTNNETIETVGFFVANMADDPDSYITNIKDTNPNSNNGLLFRWRMFKNIGRSQIKNDRSLHFRSIPYLTNAYTSNVLLRHLIPKSEASKKIKYNFYKENDPNFSQNSQKGIYDNLSVQPTLGNICDIKLENLKKII